MTATIVHTLSPLSDPRWDDLVAHHPKASIFHERAWLEALRRTYGYEPVVFTTSSPTTELKNGLLFCDVHSWLTGRRLVSLPFSDHCELVCDSTEEIQSLIRHSQTAVDSRRWRYLEVRPTDEEFGETGVQLGLQPIGRYFLHVMDLRPSIDGLFRSLDKDSVQRRVKRAERAG